MDLPGGLLLIGITLAIAGIGILSNYRMDGFFGLVPPYNTYEVMLDESVTFVDPINKDFKIEPKEGETSIFTVTPIVETAKVPTFKVGEYINTKEYVNNESD